MDLSKCQIFTPSDIVKYMLDKIDYSDNVFGKRIIDNSCGTGNILIEVVERFIADAKKARKRKATIKKGLETCVFGCDIDSKVLQVCIENLDKVALRAGLSNVQWNISNEDGLYFDDSIKFDYVVGNPPYVAYADLDYEDRIKTRDNFISCALGKFDYSYAFVEKGLSLLASNGKMVMITPSNMFKTVFGAKLRELIKKELTEIIDCSGINVFESVLTAPAITVYQKGSNSNIIIYREKKKKNNIETEKFIDKDLLVDKWDFTGFQSHGHRAFGDYFKVSNAIATLANKVFIHNVNNDGELEINIEKAVLRPAKSPKTEQYQIIQQIIFPYQYIDSELIRYEEDKFKSEFPLAYKYLKSKKKVLESRDSDSKAKWYEYGRSQALAHLNCEKLLMSTVITKKVRLYKLDVDTIPYSGLYIVPRREMTLDTAFTILQSKDFYNYLLSKGVKERGVSFRISSKDVEKYKF